MAGRSLAEAALVGAGVVEAGAAAELVAEAPPVVSGFAVSPVAELEPETGGALPVAVARVVGAAVVPDSPAGADEPAGAEAEDSGVDALVAGTGTGTTVVPELL